MTGPARALLAALIALSGCAPAPAAAPQLRSISYEAGPCLFQCPQYRVTIQDDGTGLFEGHRFTAVSGARRFTITRAQFQALAASLAPYRPASGEARYDGPPRCRVMATDQGSATIVWTGADGVQRLYFAFGCDPETHRVMAEALEAVPAALPIGDYIAHRR